jgi:hypothetical protein
MVIAIVVVVLVVALVARGRGGGLSAERADYVPLDLGPVTATDVVLLRPPSGLWGYNVQATDQALEHIAESIRERDVRIVALEQLVTDLSRDQSPALPLASPYSAPRHRRPGAGYGLTDSVRAHGYDNAAWEASAYEPPEPEPLTGAYQPGPAYQPEPGSGYQPEPQGYDPPWFEARSTGPLPAAEPERYPSGADSDELSPAEPPLFDPAPFETRGPEAAPVYETPGYETPGYEAPGYEAGTHETYQQAPLEPGPAEQEPPEQSHD